MEQPVDTLGHENPFQSVLLVAILVTYLTYLLKKRKEKKRRNTKEKNTRKNQRNTSI